MAFSREPGWKHCYLTGGFFFRFPRPRLDTFLDVPALDSQPRFHLPSSTTLSCLPSCSAPFRKVSSQVGPFIMRFDAVVASALYSAALLGSGVRAEDAAESSTSTVTETSTGVPDKPTFTVSRPFVPLTTSDCRCGRHTPEANRCW